MRKNVPWKVQVLIWKRDNWHCRYCNVPVFFNPTLKLFDKLNQGHMYYHKNGRTGKLLSLFQWSMASVDHIVPVSFGGSNMLDNYVTACWRCNLNYGNKTNKPLPKRIINSSWDGFFGIYSRISKMIKEK